MGFYFDIFFKIDEKDSFETVIIRYNADGSIYFIVKFDSDMDAAIKFFPATSAFRVEAGYSFDFLGAEGENRIYKIRLPDTFLKEFTVIKEQNIAEFYFYSDVRYADMRYSRGTDRGVKIYQNSFHYALEALNAKKEYSQFPWRIWRETIINDDCNNIYKEISELIYDNSHLYSPHKISLLVTSATINITASNVADVTLKFNIINQDKERIAKIRQHIQNQTAVKIQQDVCILEEPQAALKQHIDTEAKTVISESVNQPVVKIKQELIYEYEVGAKFLIFVYIQFQRFRANLKISLQGENKAVLKQEITRVPEAKIVQHVDTPISVKISEDLTRIPIVNLKQHIDTEAKVKIKYLLTRIPKTTLKIKVRTYNRVPTDYYDYYGIRTFGFLRS